MLSFNPPLPRPFQSLPNACPPFQCMRVLLGEEPSQLAWDMGSVSPQVGMGHGTWDMGSVSPQVGTCDM